MGGAALLGIRQANAAQAGALRTAPATPFAVGVRRYDWTRGSRPLTARDAGIGVFSWEPTSYAVPGNGWNPADIDGSGDGWDNQAIFDRSGRLTPDGRWTP